MESQIKSQGFRLQIPKLPRLDVFSPNIRWIKSEWFEEIYFDKDITTFEDAFLEAKKKYLKTREENLKYVQERIPSYYKMLEETYPKILKVTYTETREMPLDE